jgi:hypothetical protein
MNSEDVRMMQGSALINWIALKITKHDDSLHQNQSLSKLNDDPVNNKNQSIRGSDDGEAGEAQLNALLCIK